MSVRVPAHGVCRKGHSLEGALFDAEDRVYCAHCATRMHVSTPAGRLIRAADVRAALERKRIRESVANQVTTR